jgi:hypothetical protein
MGIDASKQQSHVETASSQRQPAAQSKDMRLGQPSGWAGSLLQLQQTYGNGAVQRLLRTGAIQAKLAISEPGDQYEQEADRVAEQVLRMPSSGADGPLQVAGQFSSRSIQRVCQECEEDLQRRLDGGEKQKEPHLSDQGSSGSAEADPQVEAQIQSVRGGGHPLPESVRAFFEPRFGYDLSQVRVHTDAKAAELARSVNALAFTVGSDVVFNAGQFTPDTSAGKRLLAHELTHVVQQASAAQTKLTVGAPTEVYTQKVACNSEQIMRASAPPPLDGDHATTLSGAATPIRRMPANVMSTSNRALAEAEIAEAPPEAPLPDQTAAAGLIVEDGAREVGPEQMRRREFLDELRAAVCAAADSELARVGRSTESCPYIEGAFEHYRTFSGSRLERFLRRYAPETGEPISAHDYISLVTDRIRRSVSVWARTGQITGAPDELAAQLLTTKHGEGEEGFTSSIAGATSGKSSSAGSAIGILFSKSREGSLNRTGDPQQIRAELGPGQPLDANSRSRMETAFGRDFSRVRVHLDSRAAALSNDLNAQAFTIGSDIAFGAGEFKPETMVGDALLAHELAHVAQQEDAGSSAELLQNGEAVYNSLEEDADSSAIAAVVSLWGRAKRTLATTTQNAMPRLRSGLGLQRCMGVPQSPDMSGKCSPEQLDTITKSAVPRAQRMVDNAISLIGQAGVPPAVEQAIRKHFVGANAAQIAEIRDNYIKIRQVLNSRINYCLRAMATYTLRGKDNVTEKVSCVREDAIGVPPNPELLLCPEFFGYEVWKQAMILIHEGAHNGLLIRDEIKYDPIGGLAADKALVNPDSYAYLALELERLQHTSHATPNTLQKKHVTGNSGNRYEDRVAALVYPGLETPELFTPSVSGPQPIQRFASDDAAPTSLSVSTSVTEPTPASSQIVVQWLIAEDSAKETQPGQMRKSDDALIAHELAHVAQQSGGMAGVTSHSVEGADSRNGLEEEADASAVNVVASLWGNAMLGVERVTRQAMPRLKAGLRLQRCGAGPEVKPKTTYDLYQLEAVQKLKGITFGLQWGDWCTQKPVKGSQSGEGYDTEYWIKQEDPKAVCKLVLRKPHTPAEAITALFDPVRRDMWQVDCGQFVELTHYYALLKVLGPDKFNEMIGPNMEFKKLGSTGLKRKALWWREAKGELMRLYESPPGGGKPAPVSGVAGRSEQDILNAAPFGSRVEFTNGFSISTAIKEGWEHENTIKVGQDAFVAHPFTKGISRRNVFTKEELIDMLINEGTVLEYRQAARGEVYISEIEIYNLP